MTDDWNPMPLTRMTFASSALGATAKSWPRHGRHVDDINLVIEATDRLAEINVWAKDARQSSDPALRAAAAELLAIIEREVT